MTRRLYTRLIGDRPLPRTLPRSVAAMMIAVSLVLPTTARAAAPADAAPPGSGAEAPASFIEGFRAARFGMDESAVRRAIHDDFMISGSAVERWRNDLEQTTVLSVAVPGLIPDGGTAMVSYVLGQSGRLIQVSVLWGIVGPDVAVSTMEATAAILIEALDARGLRPEIAGSPMAFADGTNLLYYARDDAGGGVALSALPRVAPGGTPILRLAYAADLDNPDVFRAPGIRP